MAKEITAKNVKKFLKNIEQKPVTSVVGIGNSKLEMLVSPLVSTKVLSAMVDMVVDSAIRDGEYNPAIIEPAKLAAILCHVANFTTELDDEQFNQLRYRSNVRDAILDVWNPEQRCDFEAAIAEMIRHKREELISTQKSRLEAIANQLEITTAYMQNITEGFKNVDPEMMVGVMQKLSGMSELDLGNAVLDIRDYQTRQDVTE